MRNIIVANYNPNKNHSIKKYHIHDLKLNIKSQIENSLQLGWTKDNFDVLTNFEFSYLGIKAKQIELNKDCLTGSKVFAMRELFRLNLVNDNVWIHDLDAWQNVKFSFPNVEYCGLCEYSKPEFNGGSMFYTPKSREIIFDICEYLEKNKKSREEPTLDKILRKKYKRETTILNATYNVGCSGYKVRFDKATKPICVIHGHLGRDKLSWDTHVRGRSGPDYISCSPRLRDLIIKYYKNKIDTFKYEDGASPYTVRIKEVEKKKK